MSERIFVTWSVLFCTHENDRLLAFCISIEGRVFRVFLGLVEKACIKSALKVVNLGDYSVN